MIKVENLKKSFGTTHVLKDISFELSLGEIAVIMGPSGTGKSTLLRCLNYLETPTSGKITVDNFSVDIEKITNQDIVQLRKKSSMVFQNFNLLKHKTALENIMEPMLTIQKIPKKIASDKAEALLEKIGLLDKANSYPSEISGGQQQRIAIARSIASDTNVILFDEPTSSLDPELVGDILALIKALATEDRTMLIVTHEIEFAKDVADRILFLDDGYIAVSDSPANIFNNKSQNERLQKFLNRI